MGIISSYLHEPFIYIYYIFFLRFLLVGVVFSMHHFQIWTFQSRFPKRMWFLSRFTLNLHKNHIPFENSACEGGFLKSPFSVFSNLTFQSPFPKRMWFLSRFRLNLLKNHILFGNSARKVVFSNHHFQIWLFRAHFQKECGF